MKLHRLPSCLPFLLAAIAACSSSPDERDGASAQGVTVSMPCNFLCRELTPRTRGDMNGDQKADITLLGGASANTIPVALSNGDGNFTFLNAAITGDTNFPSYASQGTPTALLGDFNGDGLADTAFVGGIGASGLWTTIPVAFGAATTPRSFNAVNSAGGGNTQIEGLINIPGTQVVTSDVNGDLSDDLVILDPGSVFLGLSNGDGTFKSANTGAVAGDISPNQMGTWSAAPGATLVAGDFDGDNYGDFALVGGQGWGSIPVAFSRAGGITHVANVGGSIATFAGWAASPGVAKVTGDFNGDGKTDIALIGGDGWSSVPIAFSNGDGSFRVTNDVVGSLNTWVNQQVANKSVLHGAWFMAGDFNGDGKSDLALAGGQIPGTTTPWGSIPVALSNGDGSFAAPSNDTVSTFPALAAQGAATLLSASSQAAPLDECSAISNVTAQRVMGSEALVTFTVSRPVRVRAAASLIPGPFLPNASAEQTFTAAGTYTIQVNGLTSGDAEFITVTPAPLQGSNQIATCGPAAITLPANPIGGEGEACLANGMCNSATDRCAAAGTENGNVDAECVACGGSGYQPCSNGLCDPGFSTTPTSNGTCVPCGILNAPTCNGNGPACTQYETGPAPNGTCQWVCGELGQDCCNESFFPAKNSCNDGLSCDFHWLVSNKCVDSNSGSSGGGASSCSNLTCYETCGNARCMPMQGTFCADSDATTAAPGCSVCCGDECATSAVCQ